jgi:hypothetical protein
MTTTIESILEQVRRLPPEDQARLRAALDDAVPAYYPAVPPEIQRMLTGKSLDDFVVRPTASVAEVRTTLRAWREEDEATDDEGGETWDEMLRSLDRNRFSTRQLFPELDDRS